MEEGWIGDVELKKVKVGWIGGHGGDGRGMERDGLVMEKVKVGWIGGGRNGGGGRGLEWMR